MALENYTEAIELDPKNEKAYHSRGHIHYEMESFEKAIADYDKAIKPNPGYALAYNNRGIVFHTLRIIVRQ